MGHYKCAANIVPKNIETMNFWTRNEGQIIGTLGGVLIALIAAYLTYYFSRLQAKRKEKESYLGMLYILHLEFYFHNDQLDRLRETIEKLKVSSIEKREFVIENPPAEFNLSIVEKCLDKIIDYECFKHEIVIFVVSYINLIKEFNYILDFRNARELMSKIRLNENIDIVEKIEGYFDTINVEYIDKAKLNISELRRIIENELKDFPRDKIIAKEFNKSLINKK